MTERRAHPDREAGFSLLEVMVAVAIFALTVMTLLVVRGRAVEQAHLAKNIEIAERYGKLLLEDLDGGNGVPADLDAVQKILLMHGFKDHRYRSLNEFVLDRRYAEGPSLSTILRDPDPSYWRRLVPAAPKSLAQSAQIGIETRRVFLRVLLINSNSAILPNSLPCCLQELLVHQMHQRCESHPRPLLGKPCYPIEFWAERFSISKHRSRSPDRLFSPWAPSLQRRYPPSSLLRAHQTSRHPSVPSPVSPRWPLPAFWRCRDLPGSSADPW
jgi:prepilin-type N-terminal cleavage/methylation domain-containing protein